MSNFFEPQIIPLLEPADYQSSGSDFDSINMGKLHKVKIVFTLGAVTGDNPIVLLYAGATAGTKTTELAFKIRKGSADYNAASADVFDAAVSQAVDGVGYALGAAATIDHRTYTIDVEADQMPDGKPWLTLALDDGSASALFVAAWALGWPRFAGATHTTAL